MKLYRIAVLLAALPASAHAAFLAKEAPARLNGAAISAPAAAAFSPVPALFAAAPLSAAPTLLAAPVSAAAAAPAPPAAAAAYDLVVRRGVDDFGRAVLLIDALDRADPARGTVGHIDMAWRDAHASLDQPLDFWDGKAPRPDGVPAGADLTHFREHLWFGLAVLPAHRRSGLGARLLDEAVARLRAEGVKRLFIRATESSVGFYRRRFGARVVHEEAEPDGEGGAYYRLEVDLAER